MPWWLICYVSAVFAVMVIATVQSVFCLDAGAWASWVQAFGSIGAILGAFWVASTQSRSGREEKQLAILAVAHAAVVEARRFRAMLNAEDPEMELYLNFHRSITDSYFAALSNCPVHDLQSPVAVTAHLRLRDQLPFLLAAIEKCIAGPEKHPELKPQLEEFDAAYRGPGNAKRRSEFRQSVRKVLRGNVNVHIKEMEKRYDEMVLALPSAARRIG